MSVIGLRGGEAVDGELFQGLQPESVQMNMMLMMQPMNQLTSNSLPYPGQ